MASTIIYANQSKDFSLWDAHKDVLKELFMTQKKPLKEVKQLMESDYEFPHHLGFRKNLKQEDWVAIATHREKRQKRQGKESEVVFLGDPLDKSRVAKEVGRYCPSTTQADLLTRGAYITLRMYVIGCLL
ncbi:hypothetical protein PG988_004601 [Apiospora saccharicola]